MHMVDLAMYTTIVFPDDGDSAWFVLNRVVATTTAAAAKATVATGLVVEVRYFFNEENIYW